MGIRREEETVRGGGANAENWETRYILVTVEAQIAELKTYAAHFVECFGFQTHTSIKKNV